MNVVCAKGREETKNKELAEERYTDNLCTYRYVDNWHLFVESLQISKESRLQDGL
jgi:hypothetical protein